VLKKQTRLSMSGFDQCTGTAGRTRGSEGLRRAVGDRPYQPTRERLLASRHSQPLEQFPGA
jgi:hypothetical protein